MAKKYQTGMTARVRPAAQRLGAFGIADLANAAGIKRYADMHRVRQCLYDMRKAGEVERTGEGRYRYIGNQAPRTKADIIWHLVRTSLRFTAAEIERLSGASRSTVLEYLGCLKALGFVVKRSPTVWQLVMDPGPVAPANMAKCEKLRRIRSRKKVEGGN